MKFILGVAAGKGGVGKSSLTLNLALSLREMGCSVGIMDADIYGPSMRKMLPEEALPRPSDLHSDKILPAERKGIKLMSISYFSKGEEQPMIVRAPIANGIIKKFFHSVEWGDLDCLLIDFPPGTGDIQLTLMQEGNLSGAVVVTTPQEVALQDVSKAIALFHQMHVPVLGLVENMSYFQDPRSHHRYHPFGHGGGKRLCIQEGIPFLGEVPVDAEISRCCDEGISLLEEAANSDSAAAFRAIAQKIWEQLISFEKLEGNYEKKIILQWRDVANKGVISKSSSLSISSINQFVFIRRIVQKDAYSFTIEWTDGKISDYQLSDLQRLCTCARCRDEKTGHSLVNPGSIDEHVQAVQIESVGRYALRIDFTKGCSKGIYAFSLLRTLGS